MSSGDGLVRVRWARGLRITGLHVIQAMAAVDSLNGDEQRPLLVEMAGVLAPTREARQLFGRRCTASRVALLGESAVDRVAASFVPSPGGQGFPVPTQFFTSETSDRKSVV